MIDYTLHPRALVIRLVPVPGVLFPRQEFLRSCAPVDWSCDRGEALELAADEADTLSRELTSPSVHVFPVEPCVSASATRQDWRAGKVNCGIE